MNRPIIACGLVFLFSIRPALAEEEAASGAPPAPVAPAGGLRLTHLGLGALAAGLLAGVVGLGFHSAAGDKLDAARERGTTQAETAALLRDGNDQLTRGNQLVLVGLILGGVGGGLCLVDLILPALKGEGAPQVTVLPTAGGATAALQVRF